MCLYGIMYITKYLCLYAPSFTVFHPFQCPDHINQAYIKTFHHIFLHKGSLKKAPYLVGGLEHEFYFSIQLGMS